MYEIVKRQHNSTWDTLFVTLPDYGRHESYDAAQIISDDGRLIACILTPATGVANPEQYERDMITVAQRIRDEHNEDAHSIQIDPGSDRARDVLIPR